MMPEPELSLATAICENCDWRYLLSPEQAPPLCPHCYQAPLVGLTDSAEDLGETYAPELMLPFSISPERVAQSVQAFAKNIWFAPHDLTAQNLQARLQQIYLPVWLVDGAVEATWQAEVGFNYEAVSHQDNFDQNRGGWVSQRITETRIRWEPRLGRLNRTYHNIPAPALEEHLDLRRSLGAYNEKEGQPYQAQAVAGALIRLPNRSPEDAWPEAAPTFKTEATEECRQACQANHIREFRWQASYTDKNWTLLLLPLISTYYLDDNQTAHPLLIHGQTGHLSGRPQASMQRAKKVSFVIAAVSVVIFIISLTLALISLALPRLLVLGGVGLFLAILVGLAALAPLGIVWQFNRSH